MHVSCNNNLVGRSKVFDRPVMKAVSISQAQSMRLCLRCEARCCAD
jgi:hypothetical protein